MNRFEENSLLLVVFLVGGFIWAMAAFLIIEWVFIK